MQPESGIIRSKPKIESAINNAKCIQRLQQQHGSFARYFWRFMPEQRPIVNHFKCAADASRHSDGRLSNYTSAGCQCVVASVCVDPSSELIAPSQHHSVSQHRMHKGCRSLKEVPARTELGDLVSAALKKEGFKFVGPTMIYSVMQVQHSCAVCPCLVQSAVCTVVCLCGACISSLLAVHAQP